MTKFGYASSLTFLGALLFLAPSFAIEDAQPAGRGGARTGCFEWTEENSGVSGWIRVPDNYDPAKKYGLLVFHHGLKEDGKRVINVFEKTFFQSLPPEKQNWIVVAPTDEFVRKGFNLEVKLEQYRQDRMPTAAGVNRYVERLGAEYSIDTRSTVIGGFQVGADGVACSLADAPEYYNYVLVVSPNYFKDLWPPSVYRRPVMIVYGEKDLPGVIKFAEEMCNDFKAGKDKIGVGLLEKTVVPGGRHGLGALDFPKIFVDWWEKIVPEYEKSREKPERAEPPATPPAEPKKDDVVPQERMADPMPDVAGLTLLETKHFRIYHKGKYEKEAARWSEAVWAETEKILPRIGKICKTGGKLARNVKTKRDKDADDVPVVLREKVVIYLVDRAHYKKITDWLSKTYPIDTTAISRASSFRIGNGSALVVDAANFQNAESFSPYFSHFVGATLLCYYADCPGLPFWLQAGYGYYIEFLLHKCTRSFYIEHKKSQTSEGVTSKINETKLFEGDAKWANLIRDLMKSGQKGEIIKVLSASIEDSTPEEIGYVYSFGCWLVSSAANRKCFARFMDTLPKSGREDGAAELLKAYNFTELIDMQPVWHKFIMSANFR